MVCSTPDWTRLFPTVEKAWSKEKNMCDPEQVMAFMTGLAGSNCPLISQSRRGWFGRAEENDQTGELGLHAIEVR